MSKRIIIIGAGLAGLSAALTAAEGGAEAVLVSVMPSERAQSVMAEGGINAALNTRGQDDDPQQHCEDTLKAACGLADPEAVRAMTAAAPALVRSLEALGAVFNRTEDGDIDLRSFGGQRKKRTAFCRSETGKQLMTALIDAVRRREAAGTVLRKDHHRFKTLLMKDGTCSGCVVTDERTGEETRLYGDAVIAATGGLHGLMGDTTGSRLNTGEVTAALFAAGIPMANLEFIQYHPTTARRGGKRILITEAARGEGGRLMVLRDGRPYYFMEEKYPELGNLMPRDVTAREIFAMRREHEVLLDMTHLPETAFSGRLSGLVDDCRTYLHLDIRREPVPVEPGVHYFMGGIRVDAGHRTEIRNLYAAGECCAMYHGANRLGGNSLLGAVYGGRTAASSALAEAEGGPEDAPPVPVEGCLAGRDLQRILTESMGVRRNGPALSAAISAVRAIPGDAARLAEAMLMSAEARRESRGAHCRDDFPQRDDEAFLASTVARRKDGGICIGFVPAAEGRDRT